MPSDCLGFGTVVTGKFNRVVLAYRIVQIGSLWALVWKWDYFVFTARVYYRIPLSHDFFPGLLQSLPVLVAAYFAVLLSTLLSIFTGHRRVFQLSALVSLIGLTILCVHQGSYNDMTFVTAWWTSLWSLWYVSRIQRDEPEPLLAKAAFLSRLIISLILLGGAAGKWTSEYWSGEVLHDIYFVDRNFWLFNLLRSQYDADQLLLIAKWYSRFVVVMETVFGLGLWLLRPRGAAILGMALLASIALFSNFKLFSVLMSLIGLASVGLFTKRPSCSEPHRFADRFRWPFGSLWPLL